MPSNQNPAPCGTYAAYQRHHREARKLGVEPVIDDACAQAHRDYQDKWRKTRKHAVKNDPTSRANVRKEAINRLIQKHPEEFQQLKRDILRERQASTQRRGIR